MQLQPRKWTQLLGISVLALALLVAKPTFADEPWALSPEELEEEGWEVRGQNRAPGSVGCGLWSILISSVYHGWGHRCAQDPDSHVDLLIMEGIGVGAMALAIGISVASSDANELNPVWSSLYYAGGVAFVTSYLLDVFGTFKGSTRSLPPNTRRIQGVTPRVQVRLVSEDPFDINILTGISVPIRFDPFWIEPSAAMATSTERYWLLGGDTGFIFLSGDSSPENYLAIAAQGKFEAFTDMGFSVATAVPYLEGSIDVGYFLPHLSNVTFVNRLGYGYEFYHWEGLEHEDYFKDTTSLFVLESEISMNILENINFALIYRKRPDLLIGGLSRAGKFFDFIPHAGLGILGINLDFATETGWKAEIEANMGTLIEVWVGFGRHF